MKIFALNLSLEFRVKDTKNFPPYEIITFADLMAHFFKGKILPNQQFFVEAIDREDFAHDVFDFQAQDSWRHSEAHVTFFFSSKNILNRFLDVFSSHFQSMDAAGGLVEDEHGRFLFIYNREKWTLPKGRIEWGESPEEAAIREVQEETGLSDLTIESPLMSALHTFQRGPRWVLKTTQWYKMHGKSAEELKPQKEEGIEAVVWKSREEWIDMAPNVFPQIRDLMEHELTRSLRNV